MSDYASPVCFAGDFDRETAPAKINLALHVRGRRPDGYHELETLFAFARHGDELSVEAAPDVSLSVTGPFAAQLAGEADNLVLRAARQLAEYGDISRGGHITLVKNLPVASGIGGGSADAAAALRMLDRFWRIGSPQDDLLAIAASLGADVPACLVGRTAVGTGRGDALEVIADDDLTGRPLLLVNPLQPVSTAEIFRRWDGVDRGPLRDGPPSDVMASGRNDLEPMARALCPEIGEILALLKSLADRSLARMSGSGATCFALFANDSARDAAERAIHARFPAYWTLASHVA